MAQFDDHITANPTGLGWGYIVTVSGLPYAWSTIDIGEKVDLATTGLSYWNRRVKSGAICNRDFRIQFDISPKDPIGGGKGLSIHLVDDDSQYLAELFAPRSGSSTRQTRELGFHTIYTAGTIGSSQSNAALNSPGHPLYVKDASVFSVDQYIYLGTETLKVTEVNTSGDNYVKVDREQFLSYQTIHKMTTETVGSLVSTSPRVFRGRFLELYAVPLLAGTGEPDLASLQQIWAGVLKNVSMTGHSFTFNADPLTKIIEDDKPLMLASGKVVGTGSNQTGYLWFQSDDDIKSAVYFFLVADNGSGTKYGQGGQPAAAYINSTYEAFPGFYSGSEMASILTNHMNNSTGDWAIVSGANPLEGKISVTYSQAFDDDDNAIMRFAFKNDSTYQISVIHDGYQIPPGFFHHVMGTTESFDIPAQSTHYVYVKNPISEILEKITSSGNIPVILDGRPFEANTYRPYNGATGGASKRISWLLLSSGSREMLASLTSIPSSDIGFVGTQVLSIQPWSLQSNMSSMFSDDSEVTVKQILCICLKSDWETGTIGAVLSPEEETDGAARAVIELLISNGNSAACPDPSLDSFPSWHKYNTLAFGHGCAIPPRFIDIDGILEAQEKSGRFSPLLFFVEKSGKMEDQLKTLLRAAGLRLVTKRFGDNQFGISAIPISAPAVGTEQYIITSSDISIDSVARTDFNERVIVNQISFSDRSAQVSSFLSGLVGDGNRLVKPKANFFLDSSISDYGAVKSMTLNLPIVLPKLNQIWESWGGSETIGDWVGALEPTAEKWFSAYGSGNYTVTFSCPHVAWKFQIGDVVSLSSPLFLSPDPGGSDMTYMGYVEQVEHNHGSRAGENQVTVRLYLNPAHMLAPNASVASSAVVSGNTVLTLNDNRFSLSTDTPPYRDQSKPTKDIFFFDVAVLGANFGIYLFQEGGWASKVQATVTASDLSAGTLTLNGTVTVPSNAYITFTDYNNALTLATIRSNYTFIASSSTFKLTDSSGATHDAKDWIA